MNQRLDKMINGDIQRVDLSAVSFSNARFRMAQSMLVYPVNDFGATGTPFSFSSGGSYEYGIGFELPFTISISGSQIKGYFSGAPHNLMANFPDGRSFSLYSDYLSAPEKI